MYVCVCVLRKKKSTTSSGEEKKPYNKKCTRKYTKQGKLEKKKNTIQEKSFAVSHFEKCFE